MDKHNLELTKSLVTGLLKYQYSRLTTRAYMELTGSIELSHKLTKVALMIVQAAKFAEQSDYHRCYSLILDIEGMEGGHHYSELKKYLTELKGVHSTQREAGLLEPVRVDWGKPISTPKVEAAEDPVSGTSLIATGALVALGLLAIASTKGES